MIKFFRKIRQKLLSENKFSKYLIYAIGEIVLIVIGILIALQINTWNQNRLDNEKQQIILNKFLEDLNQDVSNLKNTMVNVEKKIRVAQNIYNETFNGKLSNDTINYIQFSSSIINPLTLKERNQEYVNQINNLELRNSIIEYFYEEEEYEQHINSLNNLTDKIREFLGKNGAQKLDYIYSKNSLDEIFSQTNSIYNIEKVRELKNENDLTNMLFQIRMYSLSVLTSGNNLIEENEKLIEKIKEKIE